MHEPPSDVAAPGIHTRLLAGSARAPSDSPAIPLPGGWLRVSPVCIQHDMSYRQWSKACLLHVTLERTFTRPRRQDRCAANPGDRTGAVSFTPSDVERASTASPGLILGAEISLGRDMIEDTCEQRLGPAWQASLNDSDAKAFALVQLLHRALRNDADRLLTDTMMVALARHLGRRHAAAARRRDDAWLHPAALRRVVERLLDAPADRPGLRDLAGLAGLGVSAFLRAFRGSVGMTPAAFAQQVRIEQARRMLATSELPLAQVAAMTGFANTSHLVRLFHAQLGCTPGQWRSARNVTKSA